ncbi:MAG: methionyl-tRNA formyltransferase [Pseudomonadota bacterium]|nr:methionyl-tRNA formyltransferase [Pseudomonadota bacterium]
MRIVVHGQKAFGKALLERLLERGEDIVAVCSAPTKPDEPEDPLVAFAGEKKLPLYQPESWKTQESLELMKSFNADLCMMAYVLLFVPEAVLNAPKIGTFQYHPSLLPHHRGPSSISWPIAMGKTMTGLSIFWPNDGLDEGPILLTKSCDIGPADTLSNIYFDKLFPMGIDAMIESLDLVKAGIILKYTQDLSTGSYESWYTKELAQIDWDNPVDKVYNKIRAVDPAPGAWSVIKGQNVDCYKVTKSSEVGDPGTIISISDDGILVSAKKGSILVNKLRLPSSKKISAIELAGELDLKVGDKFEFVPPDPKKK